MSEMKVG